MRLRSVLWVREIQYRPVQQCDEPFAIATALPLCETTVATRPGWNSMEAVKSKDVIPLNDDIASRWGPRVVDLLQQVITSAAQVRAR